MSSKKPPKTVNFSFSDEPPTMNNSIIEDTLNEMTLEDNGVHQSIAEHEPSVPDEAELQIEEKEKIQEEDIFDMTPPTATAKKIRKDKELQQNIEELEQEITKPTTTQKKPRKKRQMTPEHLAKLQKARELAQIARTKKKEERLEAERLEKEQKELIKKAKVKRVQKLKEEVEEEDEPPEQPKGKTNFGLTQAMLEESQYQAILRYDSLRKQQKAEKKKQQMVEQEKQKMLNTIARATGQTYTYGARRPDGKLMNKWDACF